MSIASSRVAMPFQKGVSGNPRGRRIEVEQAEVRALARTYTAEAIERLAEIMRSSDARASTAASIALLDRGWGKPGMSIEVSTKHILPCDEREELFQEVMRLTSIPTDSKQPDA